MSAFQAIDSHTSTSIIHQHHSHSVACMHDLHDATPRIIGNSIDVGWIVRPPPGGSRSIGRADVAHSTSKATRTWPCYPIDLSRASCWHACQEALDCFQGGDARRLVELDLMVETVVDD